MKPIFARAARAWYLKRENMPSRECEQSRMKAIRALVNRRRNPALASMLVKQHKGLMRISE